MARIEAMALLLNRLQANNPDLVLTAQNALPLAAICVRVDGLPLTIELLRRSVMLANALNDTDGVLKALEELAFSISTTQPLLAAKLLAASEEARTHAKLPRALAEIARYNALCVSLQQQLGTRWQQAWSAGRDIPLAQAVQLALTQVRASNDPR